MILNWTIPCNYRTKIDYWIVCVCQIASLIHSCKWNYIRLAGWCLGREYECKTCQINPIFGKWHGIALLSIEITSGISFESQSIVSSSTSHQRQPLILCTHLHLKIHSQQKQQKGKQQKQEIQYFLFCFQLLIETKQWDTNEGESTMNGPFWCSSVIGFYLHCVSHSIDKPFFFLPFSLHCALSHISIGMVVLFFWLLMR